MSHTQPMTLGRLSCARAHTSHAVPHLTYGQLTNFKSLHSSKFLSTFIKNRVKKGCCKCVCAVLFCFLFFSLLLLLPPPHRPFPSLSVFAFARIGPIRMHVSMRATPPARSCSRSRSRSYSRSPIQTSTHQICAARAARTDAAWMPSSPAEPCAPLLFSRAAHLASFAAAAIVETESIESDGSGTTRAFRVCAHARAFEHFPARLHRPHSLRPTIRRKKFCFFFCARDGSRPIERDQRPDIVGLCSHAYMWRHAARCSAR